MVFKRNIQFTGKLSQLQKEQVTLYIFKGNNA